MFELMSQDFRTEESIPWTDKSLKKILILRMVRRTERYYVSYCIGLLTNGYLTEVEVPFESLHKRSWKTELIDYARTDKLYAKDLGVFSAVALLKVPIGEGAEDEAETETNTEEMSNGSEQ